MAPLKFKKVYIDSKFRTEGTSSNFKYELPETLYCEESSVVYVDDICIPVSFWTIEENINNKVYLYLYDTISTDNKASFIISLTPGNYTSQEFSNELQAQLKSATDNSLKTNIFTCTYSSRKNIITISINYFDLKFVILSDEDLKTKLNNKYYLTYNLSNTADCNDILGNNEIINRECDSSIPFVSGYINMHSIKNIYMHCPELSHYDTVGPKYESTIIKKLV